VLYSLEMGPYRTPSPPLEEVAPPHRDQRVGERDVGTERSTHRLTGAPALVANAFGKSMTLIVCDNGLRIREDELHGSSVHSIPFNEVHFLYYDFNEVLSKAPRVTLLTAGGFRWRVPHELAQRELVSSSTTSRRELLRATGRTSGRAPCASFAPRARTASAPRSARARGRAVVHTAGPNRR
jgi:hypothetical protein